MTETKKQIEQLKKSLPGLKEKVFGVALLLCLSLVMVASVSYAWVTMSTNPELGGVNTTVSANGALEIALSDFDGLEPEESAVGDSFAAEGQTAHAANTSWGNLVNLSSGYGVDNLVLRPAKLDLTRPNYLYSVKYGQDGRVEGMFSDFGFTTWYRTDELTDTWKFVAPSNYPDAFPNGDSYGVRAISSVTYQGNEDVKVQMLNLLVDNHSTIRVDYEDMMANDEYGAAIQVLVNKYLTHVVDQAVYDASQQGGTVGSMIGEQPDPGPIAEMTLEGSLVEPLNAMVNEFMSIIEDSGETLVFIANLQQSETVYTLETLLAADRAKLLKQGVKLVALGYNPSTNKYGSTNHFKTLYDKTKADVAIMQTLYDVDGKPRTTFKWGEIDDVIDHLISMNDVTIEDRDGRTYRAGSFLADADKINPDNAAALNAIDVINNRLPQKKKGEIVNIYLPKGAFKDFEQLSGAKGTLTAEISIYKKVSFLTADYVGDGRITTTADRDNNYFKGDQALAKVALDGAEDTRTLVAADTYGMILDLWVRTNSESAMLTLNGTPEVVERQEQMTVTIAGHDAPRKVYIYTYYTGKTAEIAGNKVEETQTLEVYEVEHDPDGEGGLPKDFYYYYVSDNVMAYEKEIKTQNGQTGAVDTDKPIHKDSKDKNGKSALTPKTRSVYDVIGFTAANRIWQDDDENRPRPGAGEISTTQGSGSCYIFHAASEEEYENTKNLLKNLRMVFLDEAGNELSRALLDMDRIYAENGKYTVPLYVESYKESIEDAEGNIIATGLCRLDKNVARRISVLVYLEGDSLENDMVMSAESVIGSLNLQFDSTADLHSVGDTDLETEVISLSASIDKNSFDYNGETQYAKLKAVLEGVMTQRVEATFYRMYTATQGAPCKTIELKQDTDGYWKADMPFYNPGEYVLKALTINGVDYDLAEPLRVNMSGFEISAAVFDTKAELTVESRATKTVSIQLNSAVMPKTVVAQFISVDEKNNKTFVNVPLNSVGSNWIGDAVFTKSGQYTLTYLLMDGEPYELPAEMQKSFMAYLGLTADVVLERYKKDENGDYIKDEYGNYVRDTLDYKFDGVENIHAFVQIYDDAGVPMDSLGEITLYYKPFGSSIMENGLFAELHWNGEEYEGFFEAKSPGRFVFGELRLGEESIRTARSSSELRIMPKDPPKVRSLGDGAISYEGGVAYFNVGIDNAATANSWVVLNDGSQEHTLELTANGATYRTAIPSVDGNSNGDWTATAVLFNNVYVNDDFYPADGEKYEIDITDETHTVVNYLIVETSSVTMDGRTLPDGQGGFMQAQNLKNAGLSVTIKAPSKDDENKFIPTALYADSLDVVDDVIVSLIHTPSTTYAYGGYNATNMPGQNQNPVLKGKSVGSDSITYTLNTDVQLYAAGEYKITVTVAFAGKNMEFATEDMVKVYTKPVSVAIDSANSGYNVSNASATSITVSAQSYTSGCDTLYRAPYVAINLVGRTDTSYVAELNFDATEKSQISKSENTGNGEGYTWTATDGPDAKRWIGVLAGDKKKHTGAGQLTADKLILTKGTATYTFDVSITIVN